jgi:8-oxo-dGTP diphosphatase
MRKKEECSHKSVGVILRKNDKFLLIYRQKFPVCWAGVAGHIEKGEMPNRAAIKEVKEEVGLFVWDLRPLLINKKFNSPCRRGSKYHYWWVYDGLFVGEIKIKPDEVKRARWFSKEEIKKLIEKGKLEPVWEKIFKKVKVLT